MKYLNSLLVRVVAAFLIGFLLASAGTKIIYSCPPMDAEGCSSFEKAVMHPSDLIHNEQDSLIQFFATFAVTALVSFTILTLIVMTQKNKK